MPGKPGRPGAERKKREAKAKAGADPTFLEASSGTLVFGRRNRERDAAKFASLPTGRNRAEFAPNGSGGKASGACFGVPTWETAGACSDGDPKGTR
jgi:hypothetical protein